MDAVYAGFFSGGLTRRVRGVALADRTTALTQETLALEILLANLRCEPKSRKLHLPSSCPHE